MTDTLYEVQSLVITGDRAGQWDTIAGDSVPLEEARARFAELLLTDTETAFRIVPFGTGPIGRPGDVTPGGAILAEPETPGAVTDRFGVTFVQAGPIMVMPEQADTAELFGWHRTGEISGSVGDDDLMVQVAL